MIDQLTELVNAAGIPGTILVFGVGLIGTIMGVVQTMVGRGLNLWPLQIATMLMTGVSGVVLGTHRLLENYLFIGTVTEAARRAELTLGAYLDCLLIIKATLVVLFVHVIVSMVGRVFFINGADPTRLIIPRRGAAVSDLQGQGGPDIDRGAA